MMHRALSCTLLILLPSLALAQPRVPDDPSVPLPDAARRIAENVPDENTPNPPQHYVHSNEHRHDLFYSHIRDLGGAFVGVGADQCYTLAAMQNARLVWAIDFDPMVPLVHLLYRALLRTTETPDALVARFAPESRRETEALLRTELANDPNLERVVRVFLRSGPRMHPYLRRARRNVVGGVPATWLADDTFYQRVRVLHASGRVIARNGDLTANGTLRAIGRAATELGIPLRVVYFSNAEQFFPYGPELRANLDALPVDSRSLALRTFRGNGAPFPGSERWHYMVQPMEDMLGRIRENGYRHSRQIIMDLMSSRHVGQNGISVVDARVRRSFDMNTRRR